MYLLKYDNNSIHDSNTNIFNLVIAYRHEISCPALQCKKGQILHIIALEFRGFNLIKIVKMA